MEGGGPMEGISSGILSYSFSTYGSTCKDFQQGLKKKAPTQLMNRCFSRNNMADWETPSWRI